jgi:hypothetical protein
MWYVKACGVYHRQKSLLRLFIYLFICSNGRLHHQVSQEKAKKKEKRGAISERHNAPWDIKLT